MNDLQLTVLVGTLTLFLFIGLVVLLLVLHNNRRNRHRAELAEMHIHHAHELHLVEREVITGTLSEVGRELHDNVGQLLTVARMGVNKVLSDHPGDGRLLELKAGLDETIAEVRGLAQQVSADSWQQLSLNTALERACTRISRTAHLPVVLHVDGPEAVLLPEEKLVFFRLFQEALNNAMKHSEASAVEVRLHTTPDVELRVTDNGRGFDPDQAATTGSSGLANMRRRAALIGRQCTIHSQLGKGTTINIRSL